ncbi:hypothetical protein [Rubrobacter marinus]|uniref:hypothetical protein n=1 Tax=Rubrobacter marinus TaxID=2653852 RepID=UPI00140DF005|nr:hypothetical protein [Rubrobacter marinus]
MAALCLSLFLLVLANTVREAIDGIGGGVLWVALFVPAVMIGVVLLRVFWERRIR